MRRAVIRPVNRPRTISLRVKSRCQGINLPLQLCHSTIRFLLPLATGLCDYTFSLGLGASFTRLLGVFLVAADFEASAGLARACTLRVIGIVAGSM